MGHTDQQAPRASTCSEKDQRGVPLESPSQQLLPTTVPFSMSLTVILASWSGRRQCVVSPLIASRLRHRAATITALRPERTRGCGHWSRRELSRCASRARGPDEALSSMGRAAASACSAATSSPEVTEAPVRSTVADHVTTPGANPYNLSLRLRVAADPLRCSAERSLVFVTGRCPGSSPPQSCLHLSPSCAFHHVLSALHHVPHSLLPRSTKPAVFAEKMIAWTWLLIPRHGCTWRELHGDSVAVVTTLVTRRAVARAAPRSADGAVAVPCSQGRLCLPVGTAS